MTASKTERQVGPAVPETEDNRDLLRTGQGMRVRAGRRTGNHRHQMAETESWTGTTSRRRPASATGLTERPRTARRTTRSSTLCGRATNGR